jgi:hypothetical protein
MRAWRPDMVQAPMWCAPFRVTLDDAPNVSNKNLYTNSVLKRRPGAFLPPPQRWHLYC